MTHCIVCNSAIEDDVPYCPFCGEPTGTCPETEDFTYEAFISYRHLPLSSKVAKRLQHDLEGFPIPKGMHGIGDGKRLGKLFRDEDELPASTSLSDQIRDALARSRFLIVVCTPETRESRWVEREIELFASLHGRDHVLVALADGERPQCLPDILLYRKVRTEDGTIVDEPTEPLAADFRERSHKSRKTETLRIVAALLGCGFDDLRQREKARRNALAARIAAAISAASLAFAGVTLHQQEQIVRNQRELQISQSRYLAQEVDGLLSRGDRIQAVQVALAALPESSTSVDRPFVPEAQAALEAAVQAYPTQDRWIPLYSRREESEVRALACNDDEGTYALVDDAMTLRVYSIATGEAVSDFDLEGIVAEEVIPDPSAMQLWYPSARRLILVGSPPTGIACVDLADGSLAWEYVPDDDLYPSFLTISDDGSLACLIGTRNHFDEDYNYVETKGFVMLDAASGEQVAEWFWEAGSGIEYADTSCAVSGDGSKVATRVGKTLTIADASTGKTSSSELAYPTGSVTWVGDAIAAATYDLNETAPYPCAIQLITDKGKELWRTDAQLPLTSSGGLLYESEPRVWGTLDEVEGLGERLLASYGGRLVTLDLDTGVETEVTDLVTPVIGCRVTGDSPDQRVHACSAGGSVRYMTSGGDGVSVGSTVDTEVGNTERATFVRTDNATFLVTKPFYSEGENAKTAVFTAHSTASLREAIPNEEDWQPSSAQGDGESDSQLEDLRERLGLTDSAGFIALSPDGSHAVVRTGKRLARVKVPSGEVEAKGVRQYDAIQAGGFVADGSLFYAKIPIPGDPFGRCDLLVFDMSGNSFEPKSEIRFGVRLSDDGSQVLIDDQSMTRNATWVMPYLSLDELIGQARTLCDGFELTEEERVELFVNSATP